MKNFKVYALWAVYIGLIVLFFICTIVLFLFLKMPGDYTSGQYSLVVISGTILLFSTFFILTLKKKLKVFNISYLDDQILQIAVKNNGLLTATDLALGSHLNLTEASKQLEVNFKSGLCGKRYTENSFVAVYEFERILTETEKLNSNYISTKNNITN